MRSAIFLLVVDTTGGWIKASRINGCAADSPDWDASIYDELDFQTCLEQGALRLRCFVSQRKAHAWQIARLTMHSIIYLVGLVVVILFVLSMLGLR